MTFAKNGNMNRKAITFAVWMIVFLFIVSVILVYLFFVLVNYGERSFFGDKNQITIKDNTITSLDKKLFLLFLNTEVESRQTTILGGIKQSLDPFFEITNDKNEHFIAAFGLQKLEQPGSALQQDMYARGFDDDDWQALVDAQKNVQESDIVKKIVEALNKDCDNYFLKIPFGTITPEGLKNIDSSVFGDTDAKQLLYTPTMSYTTHYRGENIEIKFRKSIDCL